MEQLADIYDFVSPCFPPKYDMFRVIFRKYHEHMAFMLDCVGACAESLANADILKARFCPACCAFDSSPQMSIRSLPAFRRPWRCTHNRLEWRLFTTT